MAYILSTKLRLGVRRRFPNVKIPDPYSCDGLLSIDGSATEFEISKSHAVLSMGGCALFEISKNYTVLSMSG